MKRLQNPLERLLGVARKPERIGVGIMAGMSRDGVDVALIRMRDGDRRPEVELLASRTFPYEEEGLRARLAALDGLRMEAVAALDRDLGERFARDVLALLAQAGMDPREVDFIGTHGQTVYHRPRSAEVCALTLQIGDADVLAERTGILTVSDFRRRDIAAGGEGAPLIPVADWLLYGDEDQTSACQNLGSIANVTVVTPALDDLVAFDTGPANALIDAFARRADPGVVCDQDGAYSAAGEVDDDLLLWLYMQRAAWLSKPPPKSAGFETFGSALAYEAVAAHPDTHANDRVRTAVEFTAQTLGDAYARHVLTRFPALRTARFSGGGCHNPTLMGVIRAKLEALGLEVTALDRQWIDAKEAVGFALLADRTLRGESGNHPGATGAAHPVVLGKISL